MRESTFSIGMATPSGLSRVISWVCGLWFRGMTFSLVVAAIATCASGICLLGKRYTAFLYIFYLLTQAYSQCLHTLRGHTSTVRCLKMSDANTAISGSRDTTLRVWDIRTGICRNVLVGHQASVRCLEIKGDIVVSGSYDATAKIWSISEGRCLHTLSGHFSQIYAIAFDGQRVVTGSLDTSVRVWDAHTG